MSSKNQNNRDANKQQNLTEVLAVGMNTGDYDIRFPTAQDPADSSVPYLKITGLTGPPTSSISGEGQLAYDEAGNELYVYNGSTWDSVSGGNEDLATTLALGNTTGGTDISVNAGDAVEFAGDINIPSTSTTSNLKFGYLAGNSITSGQRNTLCGPEASSSLTTGNFNVTVGYLSRTSAVDTTGGTSVGTSTVTANNATGVGRSSIASGENSCSLGYLSSATGLRSTSIGYNCSTTVADGTVLGANTFCSGINGLALGKSARCEAGNAVALGPNVTNTVANSVKMAPSSNVFIDSTLKVSDAIMQNKPPSIDISDSNFTLSAEQVLSNLMSVSGLTADRNVSFPTYATLSASVPDLQTYDSFIFYISNEDTTYNINLTSNTNCTFVGGSPRTLGPGRIATCLIYFLSTSYQVRFTSIESY